MNYFFWHKFKRKFNLTDPMENMHGKLLDIWFTWCNNQRGKQRVHCRLDRVYGEVNSMSFKQDQYHAPEQFFPTSLSDHSPIYTCCLFVSDRSKEERKRNENTFKLNISLLDDIDNLEAIQMVSDLTSMSNPLLNAIELWNLKAKTWKNLCQVIGKKQATDRNREETFW